MDLEDAPIPLAVGARASWALWNLILSIAGAVLALMMGIRLLLMKRDEEEEDEEKKAARREAYPDEEEEEKKQKRGRLLMILAIPILAIIAIIVFILTQDMRLPMIMIDWWTLLHAILFIGGLISYIFAFRKVKDDDEDEDDEHYANQNPYTKAV